MDILGKDCKRDCLLELTISTMRAQVLNSREKIALMSDALSCSIAKSAASIILPPILMIMGICTGVAFACGPATSITSLTQNFVVGSSTSVILCVRGHHSIGWSV